ncbi:MAG: hypothetical protein ACREMD_00210 [Gemmatimonadota bacterium]
MVRRSLTLHALAACAVALCALSACEPQDEMAESMDMPDTMAVQRALHEPARRDALLDTMPGGEMAIGDSAVEMELLKDKMPEEREP